MLSWYPPANPTDEERALDASAAGQEFRRRCEANGWSRTWRFARAQADASGESPRGLLFDTPPSGDWWLLCSDEHGGGGEKVPEAVVLAAGIRP